MTLNDLQNRRRAERNQEYNSILKAKSDAPYPEVDDDVMTSLPLGDSVELQVCTQTDSVREGVTTTKHCCLILLRSNCTSSVIVCAAYRCSIACRHTN